VLPLAAAADQHQQLRARRVDLALGRIFSWKGEDDLETEILFDDPVIVVAGTNNPFARRRKISLSDLAGEPWTLPRADTVAGAFIHDAFQASGLPSPSDGVIWSSIQMHTALLATGRFLAMFSASVLKFSAHRQAVKVLPVKLPNRPAPVGMTTLKHRTINPVAQLFIECAREVAAPLSANGIRPAAMNADVVAVQSRGKR
jgi:DNA-binding transcriptional LysR family regulator